MIFIPFMAKYLQIAGYNLHFYICIFFQKYKHKRDLLAEKVRRLGLGGLPCGVIMQGIKQSLCYMRVFFIKLSFKLAILCLVLSGISYSPYTHVQ